jgi:hypothetical protein
LFGIKNEPSPLENIAEMLLKKPLPSIELDQNPLELNKSWAERALKKNVTPEKDQGQVPGR